ncbi:hypothetical protein V6M85_01755 [Sulfolobus tengchongensis]|uniref:Uncharacterized protein n=1 Tax=Sulfolobus tengchongensis TaxID=207809 RepID=A0AAX4L1H3_9CREN
MKIQHASVTVHHMLYTCQEKHWGEKRKEEVDRNLHVKGKRTIIRLIKEFSEKSTKMRVVYDIIPEWLIKILKQHKGKLIVVTTTRGLDISGEVKFVDNIRSKFIVFDDSLVVTFNNGDEEAVIDSCKGCVIQAEEHFELLTSKGE